MKYYLSFLIFFIPLSSDAQIKISGRVVDEITKQGIAGVSVYINNTTYGTETDHKGNFSFNAMLTGEATLILSHIAYVRKVHVLDNSPVVNLHFDLDPSTNKLSEVVVRAKPSKDHITKWFNLFYRELIGEYKKTTNWCKIKNKDSLYFDFDSETNNLKVFAKGPLIIENIFLNYKIKIDLEQFEYNFTTNEVIFKYYAFYEELPLMILPKNQIKKNRIFAYEGSNMHFMRGVYSKTIGLDFFYIFKYSEVKNMEKQRVTKIYLKKMAEAYVKEEKPDISLPHLFSRDTAKYYQAVLKQADTISAKTKEIDYRSFIKSDRSSRTVNVNFADTILIQYDVNKLNNEEQFSARISSSKARVTAKKPDYRSTYLYFFKAGGVNVQRSGYYPEASLFMYGDMPERRIGISLPYDFDLEKIYSK
ncbi:carboxypeptidase-like regulatory domain-containing protein [Pedobacter insulae]|uniref:CarboxypepD_reg-like domain-containing protein n=1 Tax=Pedobacter insulae TaxID=414048 RepID=A0A1I2WSD0_9SPHI|nr:carboxypeptidase-like regulatory domain-containing protein [Pedobacter insulae]SFH03519.1 CarboxypepD_reg-like domain-containing protein [Pedobacter insulae]